MNRKPNGIDSETHSDGTHSDGANSESESEVSCYAAFGRDYLGPFLYAYISWLYEKITSAGIQKIFFLARDGYLMEKAFQIFQEKKHTNLEAKYVYFSRRSIRQALFWRCETYRESLQFLPNTRHYISVGGILEYWGFNQDEQQAIAEEYKLDLETDLRTESLPDNTELQELYQKLRCRINEKSKEQDDLLLRYLDRIGMTGYCAIADIGWEGRMQQYMELYAESRGLPLSFKGYYLGIHPVVPVKGEAEGFLYDDSRPSLRKSVHVSHGLYEKLFQSGDGSTIGYREENGKIVPVLAKYEFEDQTELQDRIRTWQNATLGYVRWAIRERVPADISLAMPIVDIGKHPRMKDIRMFSFLYNEDGKRDYLISQKNLLHYRPRELVHDLANSQWKTGFLKSVFKLPLPYYALYSLLKK